MVAGRMAANPGHSFDGHRALADHLPDRGETAIVHPDRRGPGADGPGGGVAHANGLVRALQSRAWSVAILAAAAVICVLAAVAACGGHS